METTTNSQDYHIVPMQSGWALKQGTNIPLFIFEEQYKAVLKAKEIMRTEEGKQQKFWIEYETNSKTGVAYKELKIIPHHQGWAICRNSEEKPLFVYPVKCEAMTKAFQLSYQLHVPKIIVQLSPLVN